jgi:Protein of unknown function (DUF3223)
MKHIINNISFKTDKELQEYAKVILYQDEVNSCLINENLEFMMAYFSYLHSEWVQKEGCGIANIRRIKDNVYGKYRAFKIERTDNSSTDISYIIANIKIKNIEKDFKQALRWIIEPQIVTFKKATFSKKSELRCPISNDIIKFNNCHADHFNPTFDEIILNFMNIYEISDLSKIVAPSRDNQIKAELIDDIVAQRFFDYHKSVANLRLVSPTVNLSQLKRSK